MKESNKNLGELLNINKLPLFEYIDLIQIFFIQDLIIMMIINEEQMKKEEMKYIFLQKVGLVLDLMQKIIMMMEMQVGYVLQEFMKMNMQLLIIL